MTSGYCKISGHNWQSRIKDYALEFTRLKGVSSDNDGWFDNWDSGFGVLHGVAGVFYPGGFSGGGMGVLLCE